MKENIKYLWDKETLTATCILYKSNGQIFTGTATCHPDDFDMCSEKTGYEIAMRRAMINSLKQYLTELKAGYQALHQLYYSMKHSNKFNPKSYENIMLQRQIRIFKFDIDEIKKIIATEKQKLMTYISEKDKFYNKIRKNREKANSVQSN